MEYLSPGVYVEEIDSGPRPIEGVSTSTAGFVGMTRRGPLRPTLVTSYLDFVRSFGGALDPTLELRGPDGRVGLAGHLSRAVRGFFENGGQRVFVQRVVAADAASSALAVRNGLFTRLARDPEVGLDEIRVVSTHGIVAGGTLRLLSDSGASVDRTVEAVNFAGGEVTLTAGASLAGFSRTTTSVRVLADTADAFEVEALADGAWGDEVRVAVETSETARTTVERGQRLELRSGAELTVHAASDTSVDVESTGTVDPQVGDVLQLEDAAGESVDVELTAVTATGPAPVTHELEFVAIDAAFVVASATVLTVARNGATELFVDPDQIAAAYDATAALLVLGGGAAATQRLDAATVVRATGVITLANPLVVTEGVMAGARVDFGLAAATAAVRVANPRAFSVGDRIEVARTHPDGTEAGREYRRVVRIDADELVLSSALAGQLRSGDRLSRLGHTLRVRFHDAESGERRDEVFDRLSLDADSPRFIETVVGDESRLVRAINTVAPADDAVLSVNTTDGIWQRLATGFDGANPVPSEEAYVGRDGGPGHRTGIQGLTDIDVVSICAVPGIWSQVVQNALINHCERQADRFAVVDPPPGLDILGVQEHRNLYDTQYAAIYYPWLTVRAAGANRALPPSGHMVGVYAKTDTERGVFKAPANVVVQGIVGLQQTIGKREHDILNPSPTNVNVIRDFRSGGRGFRVWGARCMTSDTPWNYVSVRRLFLFLEESIEDGTQWAVFEPNDAKLWARLTQSVSRFLTTQWRLGALMGASKEQAFFVKCDRTSMSQDDIDNGRLIMMIGVAPVRPAEFVIIRIGQWDGGSSVEEL